MPRLDTTLMYRDQNDMEREALETRALETIAYSRDCELETGLSTIDQTPRVPSMC
jgi:hypothetical protein